MKEGFSSTTVCLLAVMKLKGVGRGKALKIVDRIVDARGLDECRGFLEWRLSETGVDRDLAVELKEICRRSWEELESGDKLGVQAFAFHEDGYPGRLRKMPDPPAVLFVKGDRKGLDAEKGIAVVGTRQPTSFGKEVAQRSGRAAADAGYVVVSGLAYGCDTHAHEGCIEAEGIGVVVLAHGLDRVYPARNRDLADRILAGGGCLASEYPVGTKPVTAAFPERDRIQSGLSDGLLVIETDVKGGTMHTVRFARAQGRPVACIDHPARLRWETKTRGNRMLIEEGKAEPIADGDALVGFLKGLVSLAGASDVAQEKGGVLKRQTSLPL